MKNYLKICFTVIASLFLFNVVAVTETKAQINEILKRMDEHYKALTSLRSHITMDKYNSQLDEHDVSEGTVIYLPSKGRDATARIDWTKPIAETLAVINKEYILYRLKLGQAIVGKVGDMQKEPKGAGLLDFMSMSKDQLRENYTIKYLGDEDVSGNVLTWHLELTPKAEKSYKSVDIWVDKDGMPIQTKMNEKNNDATTILLSDMHPNVTINGADFQVKFPKDTKIIKN